MSDNKRAQAVVFYILLAIFGVLVFFIWKPYLQLLAIGAVLAILFLPICRYLEKTLKRRTLAVVLTLSLIFLIIAIPLYYLSRAVYLEAINLYNSIVSGYMVFNQQQIIGSLPQSIQPLANNFFTDLSGYVQPILSKTTQGIAWAISHIAAFLLALLVIGFTTFYLLKDRAKFSEFLAGILPLSSEDQNEILSRLELAVNGVVGGQFIGALIQGVVAAIGFAIFGIPNSIIWGIVTMVVAFIPNFGTLLTIVPAILYLLVIHHYGAAVGQTIWGLVTVGILHNFINPRLIGYSSNMNTLLVLISLFGGLHFFGFFGFLLGPIVMAVFLALLDIYKNKLAA